MGICWQILQKGKKEAASLEPLHCITLVLPPCEWRPLELCSAQIVNRTSASTTDTLILPVPIKTFLPP